MKDFNIYNVNGNDSSKNTTIYEASNNYYRR